MGTPKEPFSILQLYLPVQAGLSMKGLFTINGADELDILSSSLSDDNKGQSH
jgi:hypothetical protein